MAASKTHKKKPVKPSKTAKAAKTANPKTTKTANPKTTKQANKPAPKQAKTSTPRRSAAGTPRSPKIPKDILPTAAEEARFWSLIDDAWATQSAEVNAARKALATRDPDTEIDNAAVDEALDAVLVGLHAAFANEDFPEQELVAMDRVLERKLYDVDRADVQAVTDGSDDGFLYARGYIVALGKGFYDAVVAKPEIAICDAECEQMCYLPARVHDERFGVYPDTGSTISRESCSNTAGWPDLAGNAGDAGDD
ncbi:MAG: DUF4240 domain-containing protein [Kofleriaceae bacterium]